MQARRWIEAVLGIATCLALAASACGGDSGGDGGDEAPEGEEDAAPADTPDEPHYGGHESELYADDTNWLCKPGIADDICQRDLDATAVHADGTTEVQAHEPAEDPAVDCFYVYPTISTDEAPNSDLEVAEAEEIYVTLNQAARLTASCRVFAPVYRQVTLSMIGGEAPRGVDPGEVAYQDVNDAFRHYIDNESDSRGFVLIGHSQGAGHLRQLMMDEIDDDPELRERLVSAFLLGGSVTVPEGEIVGGDFESIPGCEAADQTGCVVSYASFRADAPPPENSFFGRPREGEGMALCVNPATLGDDRAFVEPYLQVHAPEGALGGEPDLEVLTDRDQNAEIATPFVTLPDFVEAQCVEDGEFSYLALTVHGDPEDGRVDDIGGDLSPEWGMHLVDVNVAMGDLVDLVAEQATAYAD